MIDSVSARYRAHPIAFGLIFSAFCVVLVLTNAMAQTTLPKSTILTSSLTAKRSSSLRVSFTYSPRYPAEGQVVQFVDLSTGNPISFTWDFGDGTTSTERNPVHIYKAAGFRKITHVATDNVTTKRVTKTLAVMPTQPTATFVFSPETPGPGQTVLFADTTSGNPNSWQWDFGDGTTSSLKNPSHAFVKPGAYAVTLTASDGSTPKQGTRTLNVTSMSALSASFTFTPTLPAAGQLVQFTDTSVGSPTSWSWNFGDGTTSSAQNPSHAFTTAGSKTVTLTVTNSSGSNTATRTATVTTALAASFTFSPASPVAGQPVQFTDSSIGNPSIWQWNFGDGASSTTKNPSHSFASAGTYVITLTIMNTSGQNSTSLTISVVASVAIAASFSYLPVTPAIGQEVAFMDTSTGNPTSWYWTFLDGSTSEVQNPTHIFSSAGAYNVTLVASNSAGSNSISKNLIVGLGDGSNRTYWVSPTGAATWANAQSDVPLSGSGCCSLATANANLTAGDTVYLRGGTYNTTNICPAQSGSSLSRISYRAYSGETPLFVIDESHGRWAIKIQGRSYITVNGITSIGSEAFFFIGYGACYNEIANCTFSTSTGAKSGTYDLGYITYKKSDGTAGGGSNHNWIHGNTFTKYGNVNVCVDNGTICISGGLSDPSSNNTLEDNVFSYGGHDCTDIGGRYNVIRNNIYHNEGVYFRDTGAGCMNVPPSGYFGNRCLILTNYGDGVGTAQHNLIEGNKTGYAEPPPDDDGANGIEDAGFHTIIRYNYSYGNVGAGIDNKKQGPYSSSVQSGSKERIYNNTLYHNGYGIMTAYGALNKSGINIEANYSPVDEQDRPKDVAIKNNIIYDSNNGYSIRFGSPYIESLGPVIHTNNLTTDPSFVNPDITNKTSLVLPDLSIQGGSSAIDGGTYLTLTVGSGSNSSTLVVNDANYFQDGTWGSALSVHKADWIAVGTINNVVQIKSIDYKSNVITLVERMTWNSQAPVWLYANSKGQRVLHGTAPDIGAHEYVQR